MVEFKEHTFKDNHKKSEAPDYRDLQLADLLGSKSQGDSDAKIAAEIAERERRISETEERLGSLILALEQATRALEHKEGEIKNKCYLAGIKLATALAERIIEIQLENDTKAIERSIEKLLSESCAGQQAVLKLNDKDLDLIRKDAPTFFEGTKSRGEIEVLGDETVKRGCAFLDMSGSRLEIDYRNKLGAIEEFMVNEMDRLMKMQAPR